MKKVLIALICFVSSTFLSGCLIIPLSKEFHSEEVLGTRLDQHGNVVEEIIKRNVRYNVYVVLSPDGSGKNYTILPEYHIKKDKYTKKLRCSTFLGKNYINAVEKPVLPLEGSTRWIAVKPDWKSPQRPSSDICIVIFDEKKTYRKLRISNCLRVNAGTDKYSYALDFEDGNSKVIVHTTEGDYLLDVIRNTFEPLQDPNGPK